MTVGMVGDQQVTCGNCSLVRRFTEDQMAGAMSLASVARTFRWRVWTGPTFGNTEVKVVLCPVCAGNGTVEEIYEATNWQAGCRTCDATMDEEWGGDGREDDDPFTKQDAQDWQREHECQTDIYLTPPTGSKT